jgi:hypothetical protein
VRILTGDLKRGRHPGGPKLKGRTMTKELYRINEFCDAYSISRTVVYDEVKAGRIILTKIGKASRIARIDAERWAEGYRTAPLAA